MKIKRLLPASLVIAMCIFSSCSKDMEEVNPNLDGTATVDAKNDNLKPTTKGPTEAVITLTVPTPVLVDNQTTIIVSIADAASGELRLERGTDDYGNYTSTQDATKWEIVAKQDVEASKTINHTFTPDKTGTFGFRAKYVPKGGSGYLAKDVFKDMVVYEECVGMMMLNGSVTSVSNLGNNMYQFTVAYNVKSCSDVFDAKLQGGLTAGVNFNESTGTSPMATGVEERGKRDEKPNYVINWMLGNLTNGYNQTFTVTFTKELKGAGEHTITGDWSVKGKDAAGNEVVAELAAQTFTVE